jgi:hypothetical protein
MAAMEEESQGLKRLGEGAIFKWMFSVVDSKIRR